MSEDKIIVSGIKCSVNLGVEDAEKNRKQPCAIDLEIAYDLRRAGESDELGKTLNYAEIISKVSKLAETNQFNLIEKIAEDIARIILRDYTATKVKVRVRKLNPPIAQPVDFAAVEITRKKH